jgi:23S rRNA pseudouridine1911/1915/1917 synthase
LDKNTSGAIVIARNQKTFEALKEKFKDREITKKYLAVVYGSPKKEEDTIKKDMARSSNYKKQVIAGVKTRTKIRPAVTHYKILEKYGSHSLLEVVPKTGRMHQIRLHLAFIGHPIVGDEKYRTKGLKSEKGVSRQLLHAESIELELFGEKYRFVAPCPRDFMDFLERIKKMSPSLTKGG